MGVCENSTVGGCLRISSNRGALRTSGIGKSLTVKSCPSLVGFPIERTRRVTAEIGQPKTNETDCMSKARKTGTALWESGSPGIEEVAARIQFLFDRAQIWLDEERMVLMHSSALCSLRSELIETLGTERARGLLTRMGYASGMRDAEIVRQRYPNVSDLELLHKGPLLHALEGIANVEPLVMEIDIASGHYYVDCLWKDSIELYLNDKLPGASDGPVCWSEVGHATGFVSGLMGRFVLHKEVERNANGCRFIGKPLEKWDNVEDELKYYKADSIAEEILSLQEEVEALRSTIRERGVPASLVGDSPRFRDVWSLIERAAPSLITVLLLGETGVGKEMFARALHNSSPRARKPFVAVNCGALPSELLESELFGVEKGAYTGALSSREGRFERANGGTLFLDEIGELSLGAQTRLLRVLQEGEIERLGDTTTRRIDVRLVAATNVDLEKAVEEGRFRKDLYYRINAYPVVIPPLRDRKEDIPVLSRHFLGELAAREGKRISGFTDKAQLALSEYEWPGNVRELRNVIERGVILTSEGELIGLQSLFPQPPTSKHAGKSARLSRDGGISSTDSNIVKQFIEHALNTKMRMEDVETLLVNAAIERSQSNLSNAARLLGVSRAQIAYRVRKRPPLPFE